MLRAITFLKRETSKNVVKQELLNTYLYSVFFVLVQSFLCFIVYAYKL